MDGIDALRAMQEGNIIALVARGFTRDILWEDQYRFRDGKIQARRIKFNPEYKEEWHDTAERAEFFLRDLFWEERESEPEFDLTFVEAFRAMLEGKKVCNECYATLTQFIQDGQIYMESEGSAEKTCFDCKEQRAMWRVVE